MKSPIVLTLLLTLTAFIAQAQKFRPLDKSPRAVVWFPDHFAHDRKEGEKPLVKVSYSRPAMKEREVFGKLVPYGKVWRTGADESTEIKFFQDATIGGKNIKAGTYSLFTIPGEKEWTIIISSDVDYWGAFKYKEANDVLRVIAPVQKSETPMENFGIVFEKVSDKSAKMFLGWATTVVEVPVTF